MKRSALITIPLLLAALVLGCHSGNPVAPLFNGKTAVGTAKQTGFGTLNISIRWPERRIQSLPVEANSIVFKMFKDATPVRLDVPGAKDALTITRAPGVASVSIPVTVPEGTDYRLEAYAYAEANPVDGNAVLAQAIQSNITVLPNQHIAVGLVLANPNDPTVTNLSANNGGPGSTLSITGTNFESGAEIVYKNNDGATQSIPATYSTPGGVKTLTITVPSNATSGPITIKANGKYSTNVTNFQVIKKITIAPNPVPTLFTGGATQSLMVKAYKYVEPDPSALIASPNVTWSIFDPALGCSISNLGVLTTGNATGSVLIRAGSGTTEDSVQVTIIAPYVASMSITTAAGVQVQKPNAGITNTLQLGSAITMTPTNATAPAVTWSVVGAKTGVSVNPSTGLVAVDSTATAGPATIQAIAGGITKTVDITVTVDPVVASVTLSSAGNATQINKPAAGANNTLLLSAAVTMNPAEAAKPAVTWSVNPEKTGVSVNPSTGLVTVTDNVVAGPATIQATAGGVSKTITLTIAEATVTVSAAGNVTQLSKPSNGGPNSVQLTANVSMTPADATKPAVTWSVVNAPAGVSVPNGLVTLTDDAQPGTVTIKATAGGQSNTITLKVAAVTAMVISPGNAVQLSKPSAGGPSSQQYTVDITMTPADATKPAATWSVVNAPAGVSVPNGLVTLTDDAQPGTVTIKATAGGMNQTVTLKVAAVAQVNVNSDNGTSIQKPSGGARNTLQLRQDVTMSPADATKPAGATWEVVGNPAGVTVTNNGLVTVDSSVAVDAVTIRVTRGGVSGTLGLTITNVDATVQSITLSSHGVSLNVIRPAAGANPALLTLYPTVTMNPANADAPAIIWSINGNPPPANVWIAEDGANRIVSVGSAANLGTFTIQATCGGKTGTIAITVNATPNFPTGKTGGSNTTINTPTGKGGGASTTVTTPTGKGGGANINITMPTGKAGGVTRN